MEWGKVVVCSIAAGSVMFVVGLLFHLLLPLIIPGWQQQFANDRLFRSWQGWTQWYMAVHPFLFGGVLAGLYLFAQSLPADPEGLRGTRAGLCFGLAVVLVGSVPVYALIFASFQVSGSLIVLWTVQGLCQYAAAGAALGWIV